MPSCFMYESSEIIAKTPTNITNSNKAEIIQTKTFNIILKVREIYRSGTIHSIKYSQPPIIPSTNNSKGKNNHPIFIFTSSSIL